MIICRSGYSSIMDIYFLRKKVLFIPTPGQTEQEYLAKHHKDLYGIEFLKQGTIFIKESSFQRILKKEKSQNNLLILELEKMGL